VSKFAFKMSRRLRLLASGIELASPEAARR
jgi:hypothetical protein